MFRFSHLLCVMVISLNVFCQNVKIMSWNLLNYPDNTNVSGDTTERNPYYRTVIQYVNPDIVVTQENAMNTSVSFFLNKVMNDASIGGGNQYSPGAFVNGYDTDNGIFYRTSMFHFISNTPIHTQLRDINEFKLVHLATNDTIRIYSCHLKAGSTSADSTQRAGEADSLRKITNQLPAGTDFIACGDFNTYGSYEPCYQKLLQNNPTDDGNFIDPFTMTGTWNSYAYRLRHTQSTRVRAFGNGSTGGLDDRFDLMLYSTAVSQPGRITYVPGSLTVVGNDGNHYNDSINQQPNTAVPAYVADALHYASDHLPVWANFNFASVTGEEENNLNLNVNIFPNPASQQITLNYELTKFEAVSIKIYNASGILLRELPAHQQTSGINKMQIDICDLQRGIYFILLAGEDWFARKKLVVL